MAAARQMFPFEFVIMLGRQHLRQRAAAGLRRRSSRSRTSRCSTRRCPSTPSLGNHDDPTQRYYKPFNMNGERFYTFTKGDARFFALDSNYMDQAQLKWLEDGAVERPTTAGRSPTSTIRSTRPAAGTVPKWTCARKSSRCSSSTASTSCSPDTNTSTNASSRRTGSTTSSKAGRPSCARATSARTALTAAGFDTDFTFMLAELGKDAMQFQVLSRNGKPIDSGSLPLVPSRTRPKTQVARSMTVAMLIVPRHASRALSTACVATACARPVLEAPEAARRHSRARRAVERTNRHRAARSVLGWQPPRRAPSTDDVVHRAQSGQDRIQPRLRRQRR